MEMPVFASKQKKSPGALAAVLVAILASGIVLLAQAPARAAVTDGTVGATAAALEQVPDFTGFFLHNTSAYGDPESGPGPLRSHSDYPVGGGPNIWVGDYNNPILQPWVADEIRRTGAMESSGESYLVAYQTCWPTGMPPVLTLRENVQLLQEPDMITVIYQRDHMQRRIYLNQEHPDNVEPSWYGHSVGHYEGDTLVVDTIGLDTRSVVDRYGSFHTEQIHVVERYNIVNDGTALRVDFTVDDPAAFTTQWGASITYRRGQGPWRETVCDENNRDVDGSEWPIPIDNTPDF